MTAGEFFDAHFQSESERIEKRLRILYKQRTDIDTEINVLLEQQRAHFDAESSLDDGGSRDAESMLLPDDDAA
jgi:hypothetical protein